MHTHTHTHPGPALAKWVHSVVKVRGGCWVRGVREGERVRNYELLLYILFYETFKENFKKHLKTHLFHCSFPSL